MVSGQSKKNTLMNPPSKFSLFASGILLCSLFSCLYVVNQFDTVDEKELLAARTLEEKRLDVMSDCVVSSDKSEIAIEGCVATGFDQYPEEPIDI